MRRSDVSASGAGAASAAGASAVFRRPRRKKAMAAAGSTTAASHVLTQPKYHRMEETAPMRANAFARSRSMLLSTDGDEKTNFSRHFPFKSTSMEDGVRSTSRSGGFSASDD